MAMVPIEAEQAQLKLSFRSKLPHLKKELEKRLSEPYLVTFKESCFGHLLDVPPISFQGQLVGQLLFCQDEAPSADKLVFHVQGQRPEFGPLEFALITGLRFGKYPVFPIRSNFYDHVFGEKTGGIKFDDIESKWQEFSEMENEEETCLKLAFLYVVYGVLLCQSHSKNVDKKYIHLVDNLLTFNSFPWGRVAFEFLLLRTHRCMRDRVAKLKDKKTETFDVHGFAQALQVWAYEVLPCVADLCAVKDGTTTMPRLLSWRSRESPPTADELRHGCFPRLAPGDEGLAMLKFRPTPAETGTKYYRSVYSWREEVREKEREDVREGPSLVGEIEAPCKGKEKAVRAKGREVVVTPKVVGDDVIAKACSQVDKLVQLVAEQGKMLAEQRTLIMWLLEKNGYPGDGVGHSSAQVAADLASQVAADLDAQVAADLAAQKAADLAAQVAADLAAQEAADLAAQKAADLAAQKAADLSAQQAADLAAQQAADLAAQEAADLAAQQAADLAAQQSSDFVEPPPTNTMPRVQKVDVLYKRKQPPREKKKSASVREPYTDPEHHRKKKTGKVGAPGGK